MEPVNPVSLGAGSRFTLGRRLGEGGFGVVYEAVDAAGARVAIKLLRRDDPAAIYRFKREFRALADLAHRNLARLYELATEDGHWYVTMELIDGVDFLHHVTGAPRPPSPR